MEEVIEVLLEKVRSLLEVAAGKGSRPLLMDTKRVALEMSMGETVVKKMIKTGEISSIKRGRRRLISTAELERWIAEHTAQPSTRAPKTKRKTEGEKIRAALKRG